MTYKELSDLTLQWAEDRNLLDHKNRQKQALKMVSEVGETCDAVAKDNKDETKDGIGDVLVTIIILCGQMGIDPVECLNDFPGYNGSFEEVFSAHSEKELWYSTSMCALDLSFCTGNVCRAILNIETAYIKEAIKLQILTLFDLCNSLQYNPVECLELAYNQIKDRKGKTVGGTFIKE